MSREGNGATAAAALTAAAGNQIFIARLQLYEGEADGGSGRRQGGVVSVQK